MPDLDVAVVVLIPVAILLAAGLAYWSGRLIERSQQDDSDLDDAPDVDVVADLPDEVFLASVRSPIGGERSLVIVDDGRNIAQAKRGVERAQPAAEVQDISRVRLFEFDQDPSGVDVARQDSPETAPEPQGSSR